MAQFTNEDLKILQALPLDLKIRKTQNRIEDWYMQFYGDVYVSFSGGKDSTVLLHLVRSMYPDVPAVFCNTGLEYPELRHFAESMPNVDVIYPKMPFDQVIRKYGYPLVSKEVAEAIYYARRITPKDLRGGPDNTKEAERTAWAAQSREREHPSIREEISSASGGSPSQAKKASWVPRTRRLLCGTIRKDGTGVTEPG